MQTWYDEQQNKLVALQHEAQQRAQEAAEAEQATKRGAFALRARSMVDRLRDFINDMPDDEKHKRRHMEFFQHALAAKYRTRSGINRASVSEVGPALKQLGWTRQREWLGAEQTYRTWWVPPETQEN
ncbi:hypothetical protein CKO42_26205 [Lamprobacter modestohalophilus]|uniref:Uncharacterized protein n=1 Tax=Lamprobacter modestohalophilus TaxID=1064514 RepID=A0A9X1B765_9GAMM|nr:hypothetical protein [Lamprobacter modestohalophilus]MBK1621809.1 hypothetical protein [Lamprobacter modestohalophilus]